jgi:hypothetical protein
MFPPIAHPSGPPSSALSPFPHPYRVIGMVMIAFVGVATFDNPGKGATSILQAIVWVSPKRQLRNAALAPSCALYASCAAVVHPALKLRWWLTGSPAHRGSSPHSREGFVQEPVYVRFSGAEGGEPTATVALCRGVCGLFNHLPHQSAVFKPRALRKKRKKRMK